MSLDGIDSLVSELHQFFEEVGSSGMTNSRCELPQTFDSRVNDAAFVQHA